MTIAKRLVILLAVPIAELVSFGIFTRMQLSELEEQSRFVSESRIDGRYFKPDAALAPLSGSRALDPFGDAQAQLERALAKLPPS